MSKANFQNWADMPEIVMSPQVTRRQIYGEKLMSIKLTLKEGAAVPEHHHPHEQITHVLSGKLDYTAAGERQVMVAGSVVHIPSDVPHSLVALEDSILLEVFTPPREDFL